MTSRERTYDHSDTDRCDPRPANRGACGIRATETLPIHREGRERSPIHGGTTAMLGIARAAGGARARRCCELRLHGDATRRRRTPLSVHRQVHARAGTRKPTDAPTPARPTVGDRALRSPRAPCRRDQARRTAERRIAPLLGVPHARDRLSPLQAIGRRIRARPRARRRRRSAPPCGARDRATSAFAVGGTHLLTSVANSSHPAGVVPSRSCTTTIGSGALTSSS